MGPEGGALAEVTKFWNSHFLKYPGLNLILNFMQLLSQVTSGSKLEFCFF